MKTFLVLFCLFICGFAQQINLHADCGKGTSSPDKIVGGSESKIGDWGWQVAIIKFGRQMCGGSLINNEWVVSAAHCFYRSEYPSFYSIVAGAQNLNNPDSYYQSIKVSKLILHSQYNDRTVANDIALLKLETPVDFDPGFNVVPVCVPDGSENYDEKTAWATGYGATNPNGIGKSVTRLEVPLPVRSHKDCAYTFPNDNIKEELQVCAGVTNSGKDTCQGDSGGPLVVKGSDGRWHLLGITSFGPSPCGNMGVYTRTSGYKEWILDQMNAN